MSEYSRIDVLLTESKRLLGFWLIILCELKDFENGNYQVDVKKKLRQIRTFYQI